MGASGYKGENDAEKVAGGRKGGRGWCKEGTVKGISKDRKHHSAGEGGEHTAFKVADALNVELAFIKRMT